MEGEGPPDLALRIRKHFVEALGLNESAARSLVETSREALRKSLGALDEAIAVSDCERLSFWAHNMKGNLLNTGLSELAQLARALEKAADKTPCAPPLELMETLRQELGSFLD